MEYPSKKLLKKLLKNAQNKSPFFSHNTLLYNAWVLYFFVFLSVLLILFFSATQNISAVLVFFLTGFVVSFFTRNMTVVLFFASLISGIFGSLLIIQTPYLGGNIFEGMEDVSGNLSVVMDPSGNTNPVKKDKKEDKVFETDKKDTEKKDGIPEGSAIKRLLTDNDQINKTVTSLLGQIGGGSELMEGDSHTQQLERLKLQGDILDKISKLEPFVNSLASITDSYNSYTKGK